MAGPPEPSWDEPDTYRAISGLAVSSTVLGGLSVLAFAPHWIFWLIPVSATIMGVLALRRIASAPQEWTGTWLAYAGIGLGLSCGVAALVTGFTVEAFVNWHSRATADRFVSKLELGDMEAAYWLMVPRHQRRPVLAGELDEEGFEHHLEHYAVFHRHVSQILSTIGEEYAFEFDKLENLGDSLQDYANVFYKVPSRQGEGGLMVTVATTVDPLTGGKNWVVYEFRFGDPLQLRALQQAPHGHAH